MICAIDRGELDFSKKLLAECQYRRNSQSTIFASTFHKNHLVACTSDGSLLIWDIQKKPNCSRSETYCKKQRIQNDESAYEVKVCNGSLYDVQIVSSANCNLIVTCGVEGIFIYKSFLDELIEGTLTSTPKCMSKLSPYPDILASKLRSEVNRISYDDALGHLFAAGGDGICYIWDLSKEKLAGSLCKKSNGNGKVKSMNVVKVLGASCEACNHGVLTGDDELIMWDGKSQELIETIELKDNKKGSLTNWISSIDVDESKRWAVIGGGVKENKRSQTTENGFVQLLNLQSRSVTSYKETKEVINDVAYHSSSNKILSVGNDKVISMWNPLDLSSGCTERSLLSSPASYSITINPVNSMIVTGNVSGSLDCFSQFFTRTNTLHR
ncbi:hypothetical protein CTEN210_03829 [Chaetoceros tenuissimus]|uniref:Uncharacterized protein n=1 Tax=Chaetoceros tenuissimus TaxID=426638 RepID=A0AAD3CMC9_9STRA|nr:hypothetical protein CTEN210_03829 [Chaetoceros tenuissimus]